MPRARTTSAKREPVAATRSFRNSDGDDGSSDGDKDTFSASEADPYDEAEHVRRSEKVKAKARKAFLDLAKAFPCEHEDRKYTIYAVAEDEFADIVHGDRCATWPHAFVNSESCPVSAAMYDVQEKLLIAVWTFSTCGDETNVNYVPGKAEPVWDVCERHDDGKSVITDKAYSEALSVSSGDTESENLVCPALDEMP